jgi:DNA invertase Pin-like site-specific DNA recombinase
MQNANRLTVGIMAMVAEEEEEGRMISARTKAALAAARKRGTVLGGEAAVLLRQREHIVRALTAELIVRRTMNGDQVDTIIKQADAAKALADEHAHRAAWRRVEESAASFVPVQAPSTAKRSEPIGPTKRASQQSAKAAMLSHI